ncbi:MAG: hypothetical protein ABIS86_18975 [Streptosporangiaceae bacterium]
MGLAEDQEGLVRALVAGAPVPPGFDRVRVGAAARALVRKRAGEAARAWPALAIETEAFCVWAAARPTRGSWLDGWDFAREHRGSLPSEGLTALVLSETLWSYDGTGEPRRRRGLRFRRCPGGVVVGLGTRARIVPLV